MASAFFMQFDPHLKILLVLALTKRNLAESNEVATMIPALTALILAAASVICSSVVAATTPNEVEAINIRLTIIMLYNLGFMPFDIKRKKWIQKVNID